MKKLSPVFRPVWAIGFLALATYSPLVAAVKNAARGAGSAATAQPPPAPYTKINRIRTRAVRERQRVVRLLRDRIDALRNPANAPKSEVAAAAIALSSLPAAAQHSITAIAGPDKIAGITRHSDAEGIYYAVKLTKPDNTTRDFIVTSDGTLQTMQVVPSDIPADPLAAIKAQAGILKVVRMDKTFDDKQIAYLVTVANSIGEKEFLISSEGKLERADISLNDLTPDLASLIKKSVEVGKIIGIEKCLATGATTYEVTSDLGSGDQKLYIFNAAGQLESREVTVGQAPKPVQETINAELGKSKLISVTKNTEAKVDTYDVLMVEPNNRLHDFSVGEAGKLLSSQEYFDQLIPVLQTAILKEVGDGRIVHIERSLEIQGGVAPYVILVHKDGKDVVFSMGPRGRFLGVDQG